MFQFFFIYFILYFYLILNFSLVLLFLFCEYFSDCNFHEDSKQWVVCENITDECLSQHETLRGLMLERIHHYVHDSSKSTYEIGSTLMALVKGQKSLKEPFGKTYMKSTLVFALATFLSCMD